MFYLPWNMKCWTFIFQVKDCIFKVIRYASQSYFWINHINDTPRYQSVFRNQYGPHLKEYPIYNCIWVILYCVIKCHGSFEKERVWKIHLDTTTCLVVQYLSHLFLVKTNNCVQLGKNLWSIFFSLDYNLMHFIFWVHDWMF